MTGTWGRCLCRGLALPAMLLCSLGANGGESATDFRFDQLWPRLQQPWYFFRPGGLALDSRNNLYVADTSNSRIRKFTSDGQFITQFGQSGGEAGQPDGSAGSPFYVPFGLDVADNGDVVVTDAFNGRIQRFDNDGNFLGLFGESGVHPGDLGHVEDVALDTEGNIYVADTTNDRVQKFTPDGRLIHQIGSSGDRDGAFTYPTDVAVDSGGNAFVADTDNHRIQRFDPDGQFALTWGEPGRGEPGFFARPQGIAIHPLTGQVYVADTDSSNSGAPPRFQIFSAVGAFIAEREIPNVMGDAGLPDETVFPTGISVDKDGNVFVVQSSFVNVLIPGGENEPVRHRVQRFDPEGGVISFGRYGEEEGEFDAPQAIAVNADGEVYVADTFNHRIQKFTNLGDFILTWGEFGHGEGQFSEPGGVAVGPNNTVFVADTMNDRVQIFSADGEFISTLGGPGDSPGQFLRPAGLDVATDGTLYVADSRHNRIQRFHPEGIRANNRAIILASGGDVPDNVLWPSTQMLANLAYRTLEHQGFSRDRIQYLSADTRLDLDSNGVADDILPLTSAQMTSTLTEWAAGADNVLIYMTGLGRRDHFRINETEDMSDTDLNAQLDVLQGQIRGDLYVIYDASQSGSFIDAIAGDAQGQRTVIASTAADEPAFFLTGGTLSFSYVMLQAMFNGESVGEAVLDAQMTVGKKLAYQTPQIETNGDGVANGDDDSLPTGLLFLDGAESFDAPPTATEVSPDMVIGEGETSAPFFARGVQDDIGNVVRAWCIVTWPTALKAAENTVTTRASFELDDQGGGEFTATYTNLQPPGTYTVDVYAMDDNMNVTAVDQIFLVKAGAVLAGNIACQVRDSATLEPILTASVLRSPGNVSITFNIDGVYIFTGLPDGEYTLTASAAGYNSQTRIVDLSGGQILDATFDLEPIGGEGEGEGEGEGKPEGTFVLCSAPMVGSASFNFSDVLLTLGVIMTLLFRRNRGQRT